MRSHVETEKMLDELEDENKDWKLEVYRKIRVRK